MYSIMYSIVHSIMFSIMYYENPMILGNIIKTLCIPGWFVL